jgi:predicted flap endonuclease-1-like 5' DNA nuclease
MMFRKLAAVIGMLLTGLFLSGFAGPAQTTQESTGTPWWVWLLIVLVLLFAAFLWWLWWSRRGEEESLPVLERKPVAPARVAEVQVPEVKVPDVKVPEVQVSEVLARGAEVVPVQPDDLEIIEGIGPKIAGLLKAAGITTFAQLSEVDLARVREILRAANLRLADPTTWAEQARLAAAGDWAGLETLQNRLKGGRRV